MFKFEELHTVQIEITSKCQASCPMCARNHHGGLSNPNLFISEWSLDDFTRVFDINTLEQISEIIFCGSFGDPIINDNLIEMCNHVKTNSKHVRISIHTNGSAKLVEWWAKLAVSLPENHSVIFGIDGLDDTHSLYRIGTNFNKIITNASAFIKAGGKAEWTFIKFKHNAHQIKSAEQMAIELGFKVFKVKNSIRFSDTPYEVYDKKGNAIYTIEPPTDNVVKFVTKDILKNFQQWFNETIPECQVLQKKEVYIDAQMNLFPCCWIASSFYLYTPTDDILFPYLKRIKDECNTLIEMLGGWNAISLKEHTIRSVLATKSWQSVWNTLWDNKKLLICSKNCGISKRISISRTPDQIIERTNINE